MMPVTITSIDTIPVRIPLDIWAPPPMSHGRPRTNIEGLYVCVQTTRGLVGLGASFGFGRAMVLAAFDNWIRRLAVGQDVADQDLVARIERLLHGLGRAGPLVHALPGPDLHPWEIRG